MNRRHTVLFQLNQCGYGGTEKAILTFCENFDRTRFEPYVYVHRPRPDFKQRLRGALRRLSPRIDRRYAAKYEQPYIRLDRFRSVLGADHLIVGDSADFARAIERTRPDIVHFNRGNWSPLFDRFIDALPDGTCCIETNIFGKPAAERYDNRLAASYFVSEWLRQKSGWGRKGRVLYNPIKGPQETANLRAELGIPADAKVLGRICRPDMIDDQFVTAAWQRLRADNVYLLILGCSRPFIEAAAHYGNVLAIAPTTDEAMLSRFYNTLDLLLHYRIDGETFGMNIAEAMIHSHPVVSHLSDVDNAQRELLAPDEPEAAGLVASGRHLDEYVALVQRLLDDATLRARLGENARARACRLFHEATVTRYLEGEYEALLAEDGSR